MEIELLRYESFENLFFIKDLKWGWLCFDHAHQKQEVVRLSSKLEEIAELLTKGWEPHNGRTKKILRAPEIVLCDVGEPWVNMIKDLEIVKIYFDFLLDYENWDKLTNLVLKRENALKIRRLFPLHFLQKLELPLHP